jgi:DNA polymerase-1
MPQLVKTPSEADLVVAIDVANLAWRSWYAYAELKSTAGIPSGHVYGSMALLFDFLGKGVCAVNRACLVFCYEGEGAKSYRRQFVPSYKIGRDQKEHNPVPDVEKMFRTLPGLHVKAPQHEADDSIAYLAGRVKKPLVILSSDKDLWGLVSDNVRVYSPTEKIKGLVTKDNLEEAFDGLTEFNRVYLFKALFGDPSDDIKGVDRLQKKVFVPLINESTDLNDLLDRCSKIKLSDKTRTKLDEAKERVANNFKVVTPFTEGYSKEHFEAKSFEKEILRKILLDWSCNNMATRIDTLETT